ncbi:hypothetical protein C2G38_2286103 [Gigaspora rosea]|uniref:CCHC-type domain-containing protein n=1 Tax=Gigaspora rosea TaxID=44941 RepID=A0A397W8V8_9GLOM|nr:hypothetical protein C2G38_2286103 [Gigaspora rosea]
MTFTLGIQSTSFVEGQNACIKRVLENSNTSIYNLESLVKRYMRPNVSCFLIEQMKESLYYTASRSTIKEVEELTFNESSQSKDIGDEPDALQPFADHEPADAINKEFVDKVLFYEKVWGLARTGVNKCMLHRDYEFIRLIEGYLEKVCVREEELAKKQEIAADQDAIKNVESNVISIANPRKVVTRRRPKTASHAQNVIMTMQKKGSKKCGQYTCRFCKEPGHNIATCPHKVKE